MGRRCTICDHADRDRIEAAIVQGEGLRGIARRFGLPNHTYVSPASTKAPRFRVRWSDDGASLSPDAQFAVSWSRKEKENLDSL